MDTKICTKCKQTKPLTQFSQDRNKKDGHTSWCKACKDIADRRRYRANPEKYIARTNQYNKNHPEKARARVKKWKQANPEKVRIHNVRYESRHTDRHKASNAVCKAVQRQKLPRVTTLKCIRCGKQACDYHHHKGYAKEYRLDVVPVCRNCHYILNREVK